MASIKISPQAAIDEKWYRRLKPLLIDVGEAFLVIEPSPEKLQREHNAFVESNYQYIPSLYPEVSNADELSKCRQSLESLLQDIQNGENTSEARDLYSERINELIANIDMILAAKSGDSERFQKANEFIYGSPDPRIFAAACTWIRQDVENDYPNVSADLRDEVLNVVPDIKGDTSLLLPSDEVFQKVKELHFQPGGYIEQLFNGVDIPDATITPEAGDPIVRQAIHNVGAAFDMVGSPSGLWAVLPTTRQVLRPKNFALNKQQFMAIVSHEVGSHLLEYSNGSVAKLKLLELALDRYECGNEGRAFLREQIMYDSIAGYINQPDWSPTKASWEYRVAIHMIISLAMGLHDHRHNFAEIFHILTVLFRFWTAKRGEEIDEETIGKGAWNMAVRALKGTDGRGGAYCKDIVYLEGNVRSWNVAADRAELILEGDKGKFDIANERHITALTNLGIIAKEE